MAENQKSSTQQAAEAVVSRINAGAQDKSGQALDPAAIQKAAADRAAGQPAPDFQLPPALKNAGKK